MKAKIIISTFFVVTILTPVFYLPIKVYSLGFCQCVQYVKNYFSIAENAPDAKDWNDGYLQRNYFQQTSAKAGVIAVMETSFPGAHSVYGHVGVVESYNSTTGQIVLRGSNQTGGTPHTIEHECNNVNSVAFSTSVHNRSDITFWQSVVQNSSKTESLSVIQYADINNDGRTDMLVTDSGGSYWIALSNNGTPATLWSNSSLVKGQVSFSLGDFNGDGFTDMIVLTPTGAKWYLSNGNGTFYLAEDRPDITLNTAVLTVGNFNGVDSDGKKRDDVILTNIHGSHFYISEGDFTNWDYDQSLVRTDWKLNSTSFTVLDLNGDDKSDLIVTLPQAQGGSYWLISDGTAITWHGPHSAAHLSYGNVEFTVGNFNGVDTDDKERDDVIVTNADGSYFYVSTMSTNTSGWAFTQTLARTDWKKGAVSFKAADLNGDGKSDLVVTLPQAQGGTYVNLSNGTVNSWVSGMANRSDWSYGNVRFTAGNFNGVDGDGKKRADLVLTAASGTHWFFSSGNWSYSQPYHRADYLPNTVEIRI